MKLRIFILVVLLLVLSCVLQAATIKERVADYAALKAANDAEYKQVINGVGAAMLTKARAQVETAVQIRVDAKAACDGDPNLNWAQEQVVLGLVDQYMSYEDTLIKVQMLNAFEKIIEIMRAEMNDEYGSKGLEKRRQMAMIMQMLAVCVEQELKREEPAE